MLAALTLRTKNLEQINRKSIKSQQKLNNMVYQYPMLKRFIVLALLRVSSVAGKIHICREVFILTCAMCFVCLCCVFCLCVKKDIPQS